MPALHILSLALAAAFLGGINLYLTVFLAGLAGQAGWLPAGSAGLLAHPAVLTVSLLLYGLNAIIDKIPAVDSLWDALHTVIRPAGAVLLALQLMGTADPAYQALAGTLAGLVALTTHLAKASGRLLINNAPGPFLNILVSLGEDLLVPALGALTLHRPLPGFIVCLTLTLILWALFPRMFRAARASLWLMWKKVRLPAGAMSERVKLSSRITAEQDMLLHGQFPGPCTVRWAVRGITGRTRRSPGLAPHLFGSLISVEERPEALVFTGHRWFRLQPVRISLTGAEVRHESAFLSENLVIYHKPERRHFTLRFARADAALAARLEEEIRRLIKNAKAAPPPRQEPETPEPDPVPDAAALFAAAAAEAVPASAPSAPPVPEPAGDGLPAFPDPGKTPVPEAAPPPPAAAGVPPMPACPPPAPQGPLA